MTGIRNAAKREAQRAELIERVKAKRAGMKQGSLELE